MRYERVKITRDQNTSYSREMPEWEIPLVEFVFGEEAVVRSGDYVYVPRDYPDAVSEYDRLTRAYGKDSKSDIPHVASVYPGGVAGGTKALRRAIEEARKAEKAEGANIEADPLLA